MTRPIPMQRGFTMLEVLVALLILLIGLLGLAGLLVTTQQGEVEAYQRKQATVLLQDMIDRLTANPKAAGAFGQCYVFTDAASGAPALGTGYSGTFVCGAGSVSQQARGSADLQAWHNALLGTSEKKGTANVGAIIDARGCIVSPSAGVYVVSVAWRGLQPTVAPPAAYTCGTGQYTDERVRRVISVTLRIANLTA
jgi:type IV pilus assembly protein PilV